MRTEIASRHALSFEEFRQRSGPRRTSQTTARLLCACLALSGSLVSACHSDDRDGRQRSAVDRQTNLLILPIAPGEEAIANDVVPVDIQAPCLVPILRGLGSYSDVGWMSPRFFMVPVGTSPGYEFEALPSGRSRFRASFRTPRSERDAIALWGRRERGAEPILYCDIAGTLQSLKGSTTRRLAAWPVASLKAYVEINGKRRELAIGRRSNWTSGDAVTTSVELSRDETFSLQRNLKSSLGAQLIFIVSSRPRQTGCLHTINLDGVREREIGALGLRDGEEGAVSVETLRLVVSRLPGRRAKVTAEGNCAFDPALPQPSNAGAQTSASCDRSGMSVRCRLDGPFVDGAVNVQSNAIIGVNVAGAF